jgi:hypothetical protein
VGGSLTSIPEAPSQTTDPEVRRFVGKTTTVALRKVRTLLIGVLRANSDGIYSVHWPGVQVDPSTVPKFTEAEIESITLA